MNANSIYFDRELKSTVVTLLNFVHVGPCGASMLGQLAGINTYLRTRGKRLLICADEPAILRITGLDRFIPVFDRLEKARDYCRMYVANTVSPPAADARCIRADGGPQSGIDGPAPSPSDASPHRSPAGQDAACQIKIRVTAYAQ